MKRFMLSLAFYLSVGLLAHAQSYDYPYMAFETADGTVQTVAVDELTFNFSDGQLVATNGEGTSTFTLADLSKMYFTTTSSNGASSESEVVELTVSEAGMATLYLDNAVAIPDDDNLLAVMYVSQIEGNVLWLKRIYDYVPAQTGVIVMANPVTLQFSVTTDDVDAITGNCLSGVLEQTPVSSIDGTVYTLGRGKNSGYLGFFKYTGTYLPANKAFLSLDSSSSVNSFNLVVDNGDGTSTSIGELTPDGLLQATASKVYDLQGRQVEHPSKGLYIVNGKKVYIE